MTKMTIKNVVGNSTTKIWSQAQQIMEEDLGGGVVLTLVNESEGDLLDLASIGSSTLVKLQECVAGDDWVEAVKQEIKELEEKSLKIDVICCRTRLNRVEVWGSGRVCAYLMREGKLAKLGEGGVLSEGMVGELKARDTLMIATEKIEQIVSQSDLASAMNEGEQAAEVLAPIVHKSADISDLAILVLNSNNEQIVSPISRWKMPKLSIKRMREEPRKFNMVVGGGIIALLLVLVGVGAVYKFKKNAKDEYYTHKTNVESMIGEAREVGEANPERARVLLAQGREILDAYIASSSQESFIRDAQELLVTIDQQQQEIFKVKGVELTTTVELKVLDLALDEEHFESDAEGNIFFFEEQQNKLIGMNLKDKSRIEKKIEGEEKLGAYTISKGEYWGVVGEGVLHIGESEQKIVIERDETWGEIGGIGRFGNNIYILDRENGEIWKYVGIDDGYAERRRWLGKGIVLDLSKVVDWVVEGDIWLLTSSGKLERYSRGVPAKFEITGFPSVGEGTKLSDPGALVVVDEKIYVLERGASRVVVLGSGGEYLEQHVDSEFARASDLVVFENKGYVLVDNVVKEFEL